jgi:hypothetical protein
MKWYAIGLDNPYEIRQSYNNKTVELNFKNIAITDSEDLEKASFVIWDRVWKETEQADIYRIKLIVSAPQLEQSLLAELNPLSGCVSIRNRVPQIIK